MSIEEEIERLTSAIEVQGAEDDKIDLILNFVKSEFAKMDLTWSISALKLEDDRLKMIGWGHITDETPKEFGIALASSRVYLEAIFGENPNMDAIENHSEMLKKVAKAHIEDEEPQADEVMKLLKKLMEGLRDD